MPIRRRVRHLLTRVVLLTLLLAGMGSLAGAFAGPARASEMPSPYRCFFITDPQGNVIETICVPWPL